jgi:hypothetical protein
MLRCFAISRAWLGGGREVYFGAEVVREKDDIRGERG